MYERVHVITKTAKICELCASGQSVYAESCVLYVVSCLYVQTQVVGMRGVVVIDYVIKQEFKQNPQYDMS